MKDNITVIYIYSFTLLYLLNSSLGSGMLVLISA